MFLRVFIILSFISMLTSCGDIQNRTTSIEVIDNNRHYYPILTGQDLSVVFYIKNTGDNPLIITDIITSCGCLTESKSNIKSIPSGGEGYLFLNYNSTKNVGYVKHYITLYGNFDDDYKKELTFDVNVVPDPMYTKDYEELYLEEKKKSGNYKDLVDGSENNKGYYLDGDFD